MEHTCHARLTCYIIVSALVCLELMKLVLSHNPLWTAEAAIIMGGLLGWAFAERELLWRLLILATRHVHQRSKAGILVGTLLGTGAATVTATALALWYALMPGSARQDLLMSMPAVCAVVFLGGLYIGYLEVLTDTSEDFAKVAHMNVRDTLRHLVLYANPLAWAGWLLYYLVRGTWQMLTH